MKRPGWHVVRAALSLVLAVLVSTGCSNQSGYEGRRQDEAPAAAATVSKRAPVEPREAWDIHFIQERKVGHRRTRIEPLERNGKTLSKIEVTDRLNVRRGDDKIELEMTAETIETAQGDVVEFSYHVPVVQPSQLRGVIQDSRLRISTPDSAGATPTESTRNWNPSTRGFLGVEQSLSEEPMQPGEQRTVRLLQLPPVDLVAEIELTACDYEPTKLLSGTFHLLKIEASATLSGGSKLESALWANESGEVLKISFPALGQETYRATRALALAPSEQFQFDLVGDVLVRLDEPLDDPHSRQQAVYRVTHQSEDPVALFATGVGQQVRPIDERTVEITVTTDRNGGADSAKDAPTQADRAPSSLVESESERIRELARQVAPEVKDPRKLALTLSEFVHGYVQKKTYSEVFATAEEVAVSRSGDCTEHSVLLAALCRARGLPARAAMGLVYTDRPAAFAYHMWNEVWIEDRWLPLDATLGLGEIGAGHLKLGQTSLAGPEAYLSFLPVMRVLGQLEIEHVRQRP